MATGIWSAASGAVAQGFALDVAANNVAGASTPGFRADRAVFRQELVRAQARGEARGLRYSMTRTTAPDFRTGQVVSTGRALDVALLDDRSMFAVRTTDGVRYTRAGNIRLSADGSLTTGDGMPYVGPEGKPLRVSSDAKQVAVLADGRLMVDGVESGTKLHVVTFPRIEALEREGQGLFRAPAAAGRPTAATAKLEPGALEMSNAPAVASMTTLVTASRQFEMLTRVIEAFSSIDRRAATDVMAKR
jgi:flagellar basal body rod protein FlgG